MHKRRKVKWLLTLATGAVTILLAAGINLGVPEKVAAEEVCNECHEEVVTKFQTSFHGRAWTGMGKAAGCESCHGSADKHQDDPSKETIITFGKGSLQSAAEQSQQCLNCHSTFTELALWQMGSHQANDVGCPNCHSIHKPRNVVRQPETCEGCHRSIRTQINKQSHHPIIEGKVKCSDCHNPHGSLSKKMIRAENTNQLCYQCHPDKRGPFIWEHTPVEEDCTICHAPHGSRFDKLLTQRIPNLCHDCHGDRFHHDGPYDATNNFNTVTANNRYVLGRSCLNCHSMIHGSTYFENRGLLR
jgi:DmsE family decaheme c-type cytochrome